MKTIATRGMQFQGELHEVHLINFSVDPAELADRIPQPLKLRLFQGRALISMVDVHLRNMRAQSPLLPFRFHYQHVAFRVLVDDSRWNDDHTPHGIYFLRSFTDRPFMAWAGNLFSHYRLETADLRNYPSGLRLYAGNAHIRYHLAGRILHPEQRLRALQETVGGIDRAWAVHDHELLQTRILRERWPLVPMECVRFETNCFETARFEGAFVVPDIIHYTWQPAHVIAHLPKSVLSSDVAVENGELVYG